MDCLPWFLAEGKWGGDPQDWKPGRPLEIQFLEGQNGMGEAAECRVSPSQPQVLT